MARRLSDRGLETRMRDALDGLAELANHYAHRPEAAGFEILAIESPATVDTAVPETPTATILAFPQRSESPATDQPVPVPRRSVSS